MTTGPGYAGSAGAEAVTAAWRAESARLVAALTRMTRDINLAEDVAQDALVAALEEWPDRGIPANPAAWLMTAAKRRAIDHNRRAETLRRKTEEVGHRLEEVDMPDFEGQLDFIEDDVLRMMFLTCHPALSAASRAALTLRLVSGLSTAEIARAFLVPESTMAQRISRAKKSLVGVDIELPAGLSASTASTMFLPPSTSPLTRDTWLPLVATGRARTSVLKRFGWHAWSPPWCPIFLIPLGCKRFWNSKRRGFPPVLIATVRPCC